MDAQLRLIARGEAAGGDAARRRPGDVASSRPPHRTPAPGLRTGSPADEPVEAPVRWRIDDSARERGRAGIDRAREALRQARRPASDDPHTTAA